MVYVNTFNSGLLVRMNLFPVYLHIHTTDTRSIKLIQHERLVLPQYPFPCYQRNNFRTPQ